MAGGHGELAFEGDDLRRVAGAHEVPEGGLAGGGGDADAGRPAVHVVDEVRRLGVAGERPDAAQPRLGEERIVRETVVFEQRLQCASAAPEAQRVDGQHGDFGIDVEALLASGRMTPRHRFAHDHPQRVQRRDVVPAGQKQLVAERMLRRPVVVAQAAVLRPRQVQRDVVGRVGQGAAEVAGLLVVAEQRQGHRGQKAHVLEALAVVVGNFDRRLNGFAALAGGSNKDCSVVGAHGMLSPNDAGARRLSPRQWWQGCRPYTANAGAYRNGRSAVTRDSRPVTIGGCEAETTSGVSTMAMPWNVSAVAPSGSEYTLGVDSLPQDGVPQGTVVKREWTSSRIYPDTTHDYWVYVPAQYTGADEACVMVFQDGEAYLHDEGPVRAPTVFDNLIHKGEMPVTIGVFLNPGRREREYDLRDEQYIPLDDTYARFLLEEILPEVGKDYNLVDAAAGRAIAGMSDGGLVSFTVAWQRPDGFSKAVSHIGSFTRLRGGAEYPFLIRRTRGDPKPIRVFLQDGENDIDLREGNWPLANLAMESALRFARYDHRFVMGTGGHDLRHGGAIFPDTLRWLWRDYPGVKPKAANFDAVVGEWDVATHVGTPVWRSLLTIAIEDGTLAATLRGEDGDDYEVTSISYEDDVLRYDYMAPQAQLEWGKGSSKPTMTVWLKVAGDRLRGALTYGLEADVDFRTEGRRRTPAGDAP